MDEAIPGGVNNMCETQRGVGVSSRRPIGHGQGTHRCGCSTSISGNMATLNLLKILLLQHVKMLHKI